jgi:hypothetical protein
MTNNLDKFYTNPDIVDRCINLISSIYTWSNFDLIIEPSVGSGNFFYKIPSINRIGIDIEPDIVDSNIIKQDFLTYIPSNCKTNILVIGNPPFGKISSLAIQFFIHASKFSSVIAFIVPKTFRRISIQNKLNPLFHLLLDEDIPIKPCSFTPKMSVKCCFQIWTKKDIKRNLIIVPSKHIDWNFLPYGPNDKNNQPTPPINADFVLRAYGGKCGEIKINDLNKLRPKSWHWIKSNIDVEVLINRFKKIDYSISTNTARQNSIGRRDLIILYNDFINAIF